MKKVYKFGTGQSIPEGAIYLKTVVQTEEWLGTEKGGWKKCWLVWHYFLVEEQE